MQQESNVNKIDIAILGAGPPSSGNIPSALKQINLRNNVLEWQMSHFQGIKNLNKIHFVGGYEIEQVKNNFPSLNLIHNKEWEESGILDSLLKLPYEGKDVMVIYSDTLFSKEFLEEFSRSKSEVSVSIDSLWKSRYENRSEHDISIAEKINFNNKNNSSLAEFTGLIKIKKNIFKRIVDSKEHIQGNSLIDLIKYLEKQNYNVDFFDVKGNWAELNSPNDLVRFILGTKAESLNRLYPMVKKCRIGKNYFFDVEEWRAGKEIIIDNIQKKFPNKKIVIRSSSVEEDSWKKSSAGLFKSFINIDAEKRELIANKVQEVIDSYKEHRISNKKGDQVLIQEFVENVEISGVVFTCDLDTGAPYYKINFDDTGKTDSITSGRSKRDRNIIVNKLNFEENKEIFKDIHPLLESIQEIESLLIYDKLDIEFAIDKEKIIHIFQVRPIVVDHSEYEYNFDTFNNIQLSNIKNYTNKNNLSLKKFNNNLIYSNMPDWNPAEILGTKPYPLAFSLYREVITDEIWSKQREEFGYKSLPNSPLLSSFAGQPYVDCSLSFSSFIPNKIKEKTSKKLVSAYLKILSSNKELFDKIEFEIAFTSWIPNFKSEAKKRLSKYGINSEEIKDLEIELKKITSNAILNFYKFIEKIDQLENLRNKIEDSKNSELEKVIQLINTCKEYGTLPFAHAARNGFISTIFLNCFTKIGLISKKRFDEFLQSIKTVATELEEDLIKLNLGQVNIKYIVKKYGHLRPGTYEITAEPYWKNPQKYLSSSLKKQKRSKLFKFSSEEKKGVKKVINELDERISFETFESYLKRSIQERERVKFEFTKNISLALDILEKWCISKNISLDDIKYIEFKDILKYEKDKDIEFLKNTISKNRLNFTYTKLTQLPDLIDHQNNFYIFEYNDAQPNFVTNKKIISGITYNLDSHNDIIDKIILIENADPGYDWLFGHKIGGIITKYGGANSHMAIRSAEIGIPSAIGVGEALFEKLKTYKNLELNCTNKIIREA
tara:strand:- start:1411 stop:4416 length:3006 start_codon:yes stop_codon:yes gene_type:complete